MQQGADNSNKQPQLRDARMQAVQGIRRAATPTCRLSSTRHRDRVLSAAAEARKWPSRDQARHVTAWVCGWKVRATPRVSMSYTTTLPSSQPAAKRSGACVSVAGNEDCARQAHGKGAARTCEEGAPAVEGDASRHEVL